VSDEASIKVLEVEMEYNQRRKPVYEKRNQLISQIKTFWLSVFLQVRSPYCTLAQLLFNWLAVSASDSAACLTPEPVLSSSANATPHSG